MDSIVEFSGNIWPLVTISSNIADYVEGISKIMGGISDLFQHFA